MSVFQFFIISSDISPYSPDCSSCLQPSALSVTLLLLLACTLSGSNGLEDLATPAASVFGQGSLSWLQIPLGPREFQKHGDVVGPVTGQFRSSPASGKTGIGLRSSYGLSLQPITGTHLYLLSSASCQVLATPCCSWRFPPGDKKNDSVTSVEASERISYASV